MKRRHSSWAIAVCVLATTPACKRPVTQATPESYVRPEVALTVLEPTTPTHMPTHAALDLAFVADKDGSYVVTIADAAVDRILFRGALSASTPVALTIQETALRRGEQTLSVVAISDEGAVTSRVVDVEVIPYPAQLRFEPDTPISFGTVEPDASVQRTLNVRNTGDLSATVSATNVTAPDVIVTGSSCVGELASGATCALTLAYSPHVPGTSSGTLTLEAANATAVSIALAGTSACAAPRTITVQPAYAIAPNWNDYARAATPTTACDGTESGSDAVCLHGGERRRAVLAGVASCAGLVVADDLDAFVWHCQSQGDGSVTLTSSRLKDGRGLADLIGEQTLAFKPNRLRVTKPSTSCVIAESAPATWLQNVLAPLPITTSAPANLQVNTIYLVAGGDVTGNGFWLVYKSGVVVFPGSSYHWAPAAPNVAACNSLNAAVCGFTDFTWLEGAIDGGTGVPPATLVALSGRQHRLHRLRLRGAGGSGLALGQTSRAVVTDARIEQTGLSDPNAAALDLSSQADATKLHDVTVAEHRNSSPAVVVNTASPSHFIGLKVTNARGTGVLLMGSNTRVLRALSTNHGGQGFRVAGANNTVAFATASNTSGVGFYVTIPSSGAYSQLLVTNSASWGIYSDSDLLNTFSRIASTNNMLHAGIGMDGDNQHVRAGVWAGPDGGANCLNSGANTWLETLTCNSGSDPPTTPPVSTTLNTMSAFVGPTADTTAGVTGSTGFSGITSFTDFDNPWRTWVPNSLVVYPSPPHRGPCSSGSCMIVDHRLQASDVHAANGVFVANAPCPASVDAANALNIAVDAPSGGPYLINAFELVRHAGDDGLPAGDDDGLCETNETCVFAPHIGAYQGEGPLSAETCVFSDGPSVSNVKLYGYTQP